MKILSIDIETTGLNKEHCNMLEFAAIVEDTNNLKPLSELPYFSCIIENSGLLTGSPYALNMNKNILKILAGLENLRGEELETYRNKHKIIKYEDVATEFNYFLQSICFIEDLNNISGKKVKLWEDQNGNSHMITINSNIKTTVNVLGKNFGTFDAIFIEKMPRWQQYFKIRRRIADPAILLTNWLEDDTLPNFQKCMDRCNISGEVSHKAYDDAKDTLEMLRKATKDYTLKLY